MSSLFYVHRLFSIRVRGVVKLWMMDYE